MPLVERFHYMYMSSLTRQTLNLEQHSRARLIDSVVVTNLVDPEEQKKLRKGSFEQAENTEAHQKFHIIEECLREMKGIDTNGLFDAHEQSLIPDLILPSRYVL